MARLFYPILFCVTAALAAALWAREGWPIDWLRAFDAPLAQAQVAESPAAAPPGASRSPPRYAAPRDPATVSDSPAGANPPADDPAAAKSGGFHRPAAAPNSARLRISAPGAEALGEGAPIELETTKLIAKIGRNELILMGDVVADVRKEFAKLSRRYPPSQHQNLLDALVSKRIQEMIPVKVLLAEVRRKVPKEDLEKTWKQLEYIFEHQFVPGLLKERQLKTLADLDAQLKTEGSSLEKQQRIFVEQNLAQQFLSDHTKVDEHVHPDDLREYYEAHRHEYEFLAKVRWEQLLVKFEGRTKQDARRLIAEMGNQIRGGAPWAAVAKARSEGQTAAEGGMRDWTNQGSLKFAELDRTLFELPVGSMSTILEDEDNYQIVRVVERTEAGVASFEEKQREIKKLIVDERVRKKRSEFIVKLRQEYQPQIWTIFDERLAKEKARQQNAQTARRPGATAPH